MLVCLGFRWLKYHLHGIHSQSDRHWKIFLVSFSRERSNWVSVKRKRTRKAVWESWLPVGNCQKLECSNKPARRDWSRHLDFEQLAYLQENARYGDREIGITASSVVWASGKECNMGPMVRRINILAIPTTWKILQVKWANAAKKAFHYTYNLWTYPRRAVLSWQFVVFTGNTFEVEANECNGLLCEAGGIQGTKVGITCGVFSTTVDTGHALISFTRNHTKLKWTYRSTLFR